MLTISFLKKIATSQLQYTNREDLRCFKGHVTQRMGGQMFSQDRRQRMDQPGSPGIDSRAPNTSTGEF